jgi:hypothetical protein
MPNERAASTFYAAFRQGRGIPSGPTDPRALGRLHTEALDRAANLLAYQRYLGKARSWKAARKGASLGFEREVQAQATQALADAKALAAAVTVVTDHLEAAGKLDGVFDGLLATVKGARSTRVDELWSGLAADASARDMLRKQGLTDEMFAAMGTAFGRLSGRLAVRSGRIVAELTVADRDATVSAAIGRRRTARPRGVAELLGAGEPDLATVVRGGAAASVAAVAAHKRKLEDTGLATYTGRDPATLGVIALAGLVAWIVGALLVDAYCEKKEPASTEPKSKAGCGIGMLLMGLGAFALMMAGGPLGEYLGFALFLAMPIVIFGQNDPQQA